MGQVGAVANRYFLQKVSDRYFLQKVKLGRGHTATVWRAVHRDSGELVAVKQLEKSVMAKNGLRQQDVEREVSVMRACAHEGIIRLLEFFEDQSSFCIVLEYCDGGDFGDKVKQFGDRLEEWQAAQWMRQVLAAVAALHEKRICHCDIKPDNFMVSGGVLKLADFGLATFLPEGCLMKQKWGTPAFMSPEMWHCLERKGGYGMPADVWAAGVLMFFLVEGEVPFLAADNNSIDETCREQGFMVFSSEKVVAVFSAQLSAERFRYSTDSSQFCRRLVDPSARARVSAKAALRDSWLQLVPPLEGKDSVKKRVSLKHLAVETELNCNERLTNDRPLLLPGTGKPPVPSAFRPSLAERNAHSELASVPIDCSIQPVFVQCPNPDESSHSKTSRPLPSDQVEMLRAQVNELQALLRDKDEQLLRSEALVARLTEDYWLEVDERVPSVGNDLENDALRAKVNEWKAYAQGLEAQLAAARWVAANNASSVDL